ncbi:MAG: FAD-dependent oxidoreductase [Candidatus Omnitrophota bacterium]|nr:FAD-dependent oxidoreductase [Candidatus Omnitrophota bacterium]
MLPTIEMRKVMIIGAGFAGLSAARKLAQCGLGLEITLFDKKEDSAFLPLLPDCLGRGVNPEFLLSNIENFCGKLKIKRVREEAAAVDFESQQVVTLASKYAYDFLIIASGSQTNFFSNQAAQNYAYALNNINDLKPITEALEGNKFEYFIICGGGYTGVEIAANLWLYFKKAGRDKKIIIVERAPVILGPLPDWIKTYVQNNLKSMGVEILANSVIEEIQKDRVRVSGRPVFEKAMLIWSPGVRTADFIQQLPVAKNPQGRIVVDEYLRANPHCFCAGDTAFFGDKNNFLRMAVQFAINQGNQAAVNIIRSIKNLPLKKFRPLDLGYIIPLANNKSCGEVFGFKLKGLLPTALHFIMCIFRSAGFKNKVGIISDLIKSLPGPYFIGPGKV